MRKTENLELNLPEPDDFFDVSHQNENFETIDEELNNKAETNGSNASGNWNINITGNAKTATKATSADKLNTNAGSATQPTYFEDGIPKACTYKLEKSVPADAVFTDTKYKIRTRMTELGFTCGETYTVQQFFDTLYDKGISENTLLYFIYDNSSAAKVSDGTTTIDMNGVSCYISVSNKYQVYVKHNAIVTNERKAYLLYKKHDGSATPSSQGIVDLTSTVATSCTGNSATATKATSADSATNLKNTYTKDTRPASANVDMTANLGLVSYMLATSSMTEGKPCFDGHILTFNWDGTTGNGAQLFLPNNTGNNAQFRGRSNSSGWEDWKTFLDSNNYSNYAIPLAGTTALAGDITPETNNKYDLGDATHRFYYGYFENIYAKQSLHSLYHYIEDSSGVNQGRLEYSGLTDVMYSSYVSTSTNDLTESDIVGIDLYGYTNLRVRAQNRLYFNAGTTISASMSITTGSDEKIKKFTDDIEQDKEALIKLFDIIQIKSYRYRYSKGNALTLGFSAQDVEEACNEIGIDPEKYGILNISYNHHMCQGEEEDMKYYPKFYEISYNDMYNLALFKIQSMEKEHKEILEEHNNRLKALEEKLV